MDFFIVDSKDTTFVDLCRCKYFRHVSRQHRTVAGEGYPGAPIPRRSLHRHLVRAARFVELSRTLSWRLRGVSCFAIRRECIDNEAADRPWYRAVTSLWHFQELTMGDENPRHRSAAPCFRY